MRMTTLIATLRSWVKSLWSFARNPAPPASATASDPISEALPATPPGDTGSDPEHSQAGDTPRETPGEPDGSSEDPPSSEALDDDRQPNESTSTSVRTPSGSAVPEHEPSLSSTDATHQVPLCSAEAEPEESSTLTPSADDDGAYSPPNSGEHPADGEPDRGDRGNTSAGNSRRTKRRPREIPGRRHQQPGTQGTARRKPPSSRPELICRRVPGSATWEVIVSADEECQLAAVHLEGETLDSTRRQCSVPSLRGRVTVSCQDGQKHVIPLFEGDPLIFKLRKNWAGEGRRIARMTSGHFIVVAPNSLPRTGRAPVEPDSCADPAFQAHYFHRDATAEDAGVDGLPEWSGSLPATGIELTGQHLFDDSDDGMLFVGDAPTLESSPEIEWARVGEETEQGWGQNFLPDEQSLPDVLAGREGRFFLRVYNSEVSLLDSVAFRYVRDLRRIEVDGAEYAQHTVLVPRKTGHPPTEVCFVGTDGSTLTPVLPPQASQAMVLTGRVAVPPHPDADRISCSLGSAANALNIVLDLPRIWWRLEDGRPAPGDWCDTPLVMTREEFRTHAYANGTISLLSKRQASARAGFGDEPDQRYSRTIEGDRIAIPLSNFVDYAQIDERLNDDALFNVEWAGQIVPLIVISADPIPEVVSFTAEPATICAGQDANLAWTTRNAGDARVAIDPEVGVVESNGACIVRPSRTTRYTLTLAVSGADEVGSTVTVAVDSPPGPGGQRAARVMSRGGGWRSGKGFSSGELLDAGLTVREARNRSIPIDRRRRTSHRANVEAIRNVLDA